MTALPRSWYAALMAFASLALSAAIVLVLVPVGEVADSSCGLPLQAAFRRSAVCSEPGQRRLTISIILAVLAVLLFTVAWVRRRRTVSSK